MEVGEREIIYTYRYIVTTTVTSALRWAAMRAILMTKESRSRFEPRSRRLPA